MLCSCNAQETKKAIVDKNGREKLLGVVTKEDFEVHPFARWFNANHDTYTVDKENINSFKGKLGSYEIKVFMGTWCGDSKREVPKFYKILEALDFPMDQLTMVAVDYMSPNYKKSPGGEEKGLNVVKVPTFIFFKEGKEVNRIVESPIESLEKDMAAIIDGKHYVPNYKNLLKLPQD